MQMMMTKKVLKKSASIQAIRNAVKDAHMAASE
jgi:hypothetical protein